jgi:hypothetical protein
MTRSSQIPRDAVILRTYAELAAEADAFFNDFYGELLAVGDPGIGKSETFKQRIRRHPDRHRNRTPRNAAEKEMT